jgi:hypothetical protein
LLSAAKAEIYAMVALEGMTVSQIATRRKCSRRYVRKIKKELTDLGLFRNVVPPPPQDPGTPGTSERAQRRLHAQKFRIELVRPISQRYLKDSVGSCFKLDGNDVQCFQEVICVQAKDKSFFGDSEEQALDSSMEYWNRFFVRLENQLKVLILKDRRQNIRMTYHEWATGPCELAEECEKRGDPLRIYAKDGKLRYTTDWSSLHEREAHHAKTGMQDSEAGNRFIEDVLDHPAAPKYTELCKIVESIALHNAEMAAGLNAVVKLMKGPEQQEFQPLEEADYFG